MTKEKLLERIGEVNEAVGKMWYDKLEELEKEQLGIELDNLSGFERRVELEKHAPDVSKDKQAKKIEDFSSIHWPQTIVENPPGAYEHETEKEPKVSEELMKEYLENLNEIDEEKIAEGDMEELERLREVYEDFHSKVEWE